MARYPFEIMACKLESIYEKMLEKTKDLEEHNEKMLEKILDLNKKIDSLLEDK